MKKILICILLLLNLKAVSQEKRMLSFDLFAGTVDTLSVVNFDTTIIAEHTNFFVGSIDNNINVLDETTPTTNIYPGSNFTRKKQASILYGINDFPIRTSVKLFIQENGSLIGLCSGTMISRKHVLTACHCVAPMIKDSIKHDSILVSPIYDNGVFSNLFTSSWVRKVYIFKQWDLTRDIAILELEDPIGENTGWISIGFDADDVNLLDGIFYKFSYPNVYMPQLDSSVYNGDTLYCSYGLATYAAENYLAVGGSTSGIPGESGSSLIKIENGNFYTSYGVLSTSTGLRHSRFSNWKYFALKDIIKNDLSLNITNLELEDEVKISPNPTKDIIYIQFPDLLRDNTVSVLNLQGQILQAQSNQNEEIELNLMDLPIGVYLVKIESQGKVITKKIVKSSY